MKEKRPPRNLREELSYSALIQLLEAQDPEKLARVLLAVLDGNKDLRRAVNALA